MEQLPISVDQPIEDGQQARRRLVIQPTTVPAESTAVRLTIEPEALKDLFLNQLQQTAAFDFIWPAQSSLVQDTTPPRVELVAVRGGLVEIELSEEVDPAVASSLITIDAAATIWTLDSDGYTLQTPTALGNGTHELRIGTAALDLAGLGLAEEFLVQLTVDPLNPVATAHQTVDPRLVANSTIDNSFGFQGLQLDDETGFLYVRNRYFDPELGRFISPDPLGFVDGPSMYMFAGYSPLSYRDPFGLETVKCESAESLQEDIENSKNRIRWLKETGLEDTPVGEGSDVTVAQTTCTLWKDTVTGEKWTETKTERFESNLQEAPCSFLCTSVHERSHREQCLQEGERYFDLTRREKELPAYERGLACLESAKANGTLELTTKGVEFSKPKPIPGCMIP